MVGAPYTTETELGSGDEFLIIACDGVGDLLPFKCLLILTNYNYLILIDTIRVVMGRNRRSRSRRSR